MGRLHRRPDQRAPHGVHIRLVRGCEPRLPSRAAGDDPNASALVECALVGLARPGGVVVVCILSLHVGAAA